jgi:hypothetical protein
MASVYFHEVMEAATDPTFAAWYDEDGYENADKCAWQYGPHTRTSGNTQLGGRRWLIQQNWVYDPPASGCALCYRESCAIK